MDANQVIGVAGSVLGILGGLVGTWFSIRNTSIPRERTLLVRAAALFWLLMASMVGLMFAIPWHYHPMLVATYCIVLTLFVRGVNSRMAATRQTS